MSFYQTIYNRFRKAGYTEAAALGFLGNWQTESGCEPNRLEGDFSAYRTISKEYTAKVESGAISKHTFASDQKGYGLAQWTFYDFSTGQGRKLDLYDFWKKSGKALDDVTMQFDFALWELTHTYTHVAREVKGNNDLWSCVDIICRKYEQPYYNNVDVRYNDALNIKKQIDLGDWDHDDESEPEKPEEPETWPPRMIDEHCEGFPEIKLLQALLVCHGYTVVIDGIFGKALKEKVEAYQRDNGLVPDGVVGNMTWGKLLERM